MHPNIFGDYICIDILKRRVGYTPAYTLKSICIQTLNSFASDKIDQDYGGAIDCEQRVKETEEKKRFLELHGVPMPSPGAKYECKKCEFGRATPSVDRPCDAANSGAGSSKPPNLRASHQPTSKDDVEVAQEPE